MNLKIMLTAFALLSPHIINAADEEDFSHGHEAPGSAEYIEGCLRLYMGPETENIEMAVEKLEESVAAGFSYAKHRLATIFLDPEYGVVNHVRALELMGEARDEKVPHAMLWFAKSFAEGTNDQPKDAVQASELLDSVLVHAGDDDEILLDIAQLFLDGIGDVAPNHDKAKQAFETTAELGDLDACEELMNLYSPGGAFSGHPDAADQLLKYEGMLNEFLERDNSFDGDEVWSYNEDDGNWPDDDDDDDDD